MVSDITKEEVQMTNDHHSVHRGKIFFTNDVLNTDYIFIHTPASAVDMIFGTTMYELALS